MHKCSHDHDVIGQLKPNQSIGIFDSGVGGFSVYSEIKNITDLPLVYVGDCAHAPYGNKSEDEIRERIKHILLFLKQYGVTYFVSACNSMSVLTTDKLLEEVGIPKEVYCNMIDLVDAITFPEDSKVLVTGTVATIQSSVYQTLLSKKALAHEVFSPKDLASAIETNNQQLIVNEITATLTFAKEKKCSQVLYACTHYPLVDYVFRQVAKEIGYEGGFINPASYIFDKVPHMHDNATHQDVFITTKDTEVFRTYTGNASVLVCNI